MRPKTLSERQKSELKARKSVQGSPVSQDLIEALQDDIKHRALLEQEMELFCTKSLCERYGIGERIVYEVRKDMVARGDIPELRNLGQRF